MYNARESLCWTFKWKAGKDASVMNGNTRRHRKLYGFKLRLEMEGGWWLPCSLAKRKAENDVILENTMWTSYGSKLTRTPGCKWLCVSRSVTGTIRSFRGKVRRLMSAFQPGAPNHYVIQFNGRKYVTTETAARGQDLEVRMKDLIKSQT